MDFFRPIKIIVVTTFVLTLACWLSVIWSQACIIAHQRQLLDDNNRLMQAMSFSSLTIFPAGTLESNLSLRQISIPEGYSPFAPFDAPKTHRLILPEMY